MSELRVPTVALDAEILCADGRTFTGRIFLPAAASHHAGPMRADEWMNDPQPFFPFLPAGAGAAVIVNRAQVVVLTLAAEAPRAEAEPDTLQRAVVVECGERRVPGTLAIDMPEGQRRVRDYLNRPEPFLVVHDGGRRHLVRKALITRVVESRG